MNEETDPFMEDMAKQTEFTDEELAEIYKDQPVCQCERCVPPDYTKILKRTEWK